MSRDWRALTLEYHDIVDQQERDFSGFPGSSSGSYKLAPSVFAAHLRAITAAGSVVAPHAALTAPARDRRIMLTFDDGGVSAIATAAPLLEAAGVRGIFLMTSDFVGRPTFMSGPQLRELHARGHVVGTHSCTHPIRMAALARDAIVREWRDSLRALEDIIGNAVDVASVPGGYFSRSVAAAAAETGIRFLFTSEPSRRVVSIDGCTVLGRYTLRQWHSARTAARLVAPVSLMRSSQWLSWNMRKIAKRIAGERYLKWRARMFQDA